MKFGELKSGRTFRRWCSIGLVIAAASFALANSGRAQTSQDPSKSPTETPSAQAPSATPTKSAQDQDDAKTRVRYVVAGDAGAKVRNIYDAAGLVVLDAPKGSLLAVYRERADWLEVEAPGGYPVWVFGEFLKPTSDTGVLEVTQKNVRQRPNPSAETDNMPLRQELAKGTRLRFIARNNESKPFAEDWIKVYSAPGTRAWVAKSEVTSLPAGQDGAALWSKAVLDASQRAPVAVVGATVPASAPKSDVAKVDDASKVQPSPDKARKLIKDADAQLEKERAKLKADGNPDYAPVRKLYDEAQLYAGTDKDLNELIRARISQVDTLAELSSVKSQLESQKTALEQDKAKRDAKMAEAAKQRDIFAGRFDARGWLEKVTIAGQPTAYRLRYGGDVIAEILCNSGRYDLDAFLNYDIGVSGNELRGAQTSPSHIANRARVLDISRIEVIAGRASH